MKRKIVNVLICIFLATPILIPCIASSTDEPEIVDDDGDTIFPYSDILSVKFYEYEDEEEYLFIEIIFKDLRWKWRVERTVGWSIKGIDYTVYHKVWNMGNVHNAIYSNGVYNNVEGDYDVINGTIIWKIPKTLIGNPEPGDIIIDTWAFGGFEPSYLIGGGFVLFADYAPNKGYGNNYVIQY